MTLNLNSNQNPIPVPVVSASGEGVMTPAMLAQLEGASTMTDVTLYLSPFGNDSNDGLTPATALLTPQAAWVALTSLSRFGFGHIDCAPGTYLMAGTTNGTPNSDGGYLNGQQAKGAGSPPFWVGKFTNEVGTRTVTAADADAVNLADSTLVMTTNEFKGLWVICTEAANEINVGARMQIASNDVTSVTMSTPLPAAISIGDKFQIQQPSVIFQLQESVIFGTNLYVGFQGINFQLNGSDLIFVDLTRAVMDGVIVDGGFTGALVILLGAFVKAAINGPWSIDGDADPISGFSNNGALFRDIVMIYGDGQSLLYQHAFESGAMLPNNGNGNANIILTSPIATNFSISAAEGGFMEIFDGSNGLVPVVIDGQDPFSISPSPLTVFSGATADIEELEVINATGPAITVEQGSYAYVQAVIGVTGNAGVGLSVDQNSSITSIDNTVTGAGGDTSVAGTVKTYGDLPYVEPNTLGGIFVA